MYATGECNFSDHGANRLGASALMQGLADGYFILPYTIGAYLSKEIATKPISTEHPAFVEAENKVRNDLSRLLGINGNMTVDEYHRELGKVMWDKVGMARNEAGLKQAVSEIQQIRSDFWKNVRVPGKAEELNVELEKAARVADFLELGELMALDALNRNESCGGHFRSEYQTDGEAQRRDDEYMYVSVWEHNSNVSTPVLHKEELKYEVVKPTTRSYK